MPIALTSRYQRNETALVEDRHGRPQLAIVYQPPTAQNLRVSDYLWQGVDRVDTVAQRYYGSEAAWWMYAEHNRTATLDWTQPPDGMPVMVPRGMA